MESLSKYAKVVVEVNEENPTPIATITDDAVEVAEGYRVQFTPYEFLPEDSDGIRDSRESNSTVVHLANHK